MALPPGNLLDGCFMSGKQSPSADRSSPPEPCPSRNLAGTGGTNKVLFWAVPARLEKIEVHDRADTMLAPRSADRV